MTESEAHLEPQAGLPCPACGADASQSTDPEHLWRAVCYCGHARFYDYRFLDGDDSSALPD